MSSPEVHIDWKRVDEYLEFQCTAEEIAERIGVHPNTLNNYSKKLHGCTFYEYSKQKRKAGLVSLRRQAWQMGKTNAAVLIFLLKNYLKFTDNDGPQDEESRNRVAPMTKEQAKKLLDERMKRDEPNAVP